jgi:hypothetical protein
MPAPTQIQPDDPETAAIARQRLRERQKLLGLMLLVLFIVVLALVRFGKTIPWGAR